MSYEEHSAFHRLLATKHQPAEEPLALEILNANPELASWEWPGPDEKGEPFVKGSTALHYAANDGKLQLAERLIELGADVNASKACWFRSVLSWAANNARVESIRLLLEKGASPRSLDALHAAAWGGSARGNVRPEEYAETLRILIDAGADVNDRRSSDGKTPLGVALESGNRGAIEFLRSRGAAER